MFGEYLKFFELRAAHVPETVDPTFIDPMYSSVTASYIDNQVFNPFPDSPAELQQIQETYTATEWVL